MRKSINDNGKQKATSFPVKILTVENRDVESKSGSLFEATFTMSFPDDVDEKVKLQREEEEQNQQKSAQFNVSKFHIMISFFSNNALLEAFFL